MEYSIDLWSEETKAWQAENRRLASEGWTMVTEYNLNEVVHYAIKDGQRIDRTPPETHHDPLPNPSQTPCR